MTRRAVLTEHETESVRGIPGQLPEGEQLLWQGSPDWKQLARRAFHVNWLAGYFTVLLVLHGGAGFAAGQTVTQVAASLAIPVLLAVGAVGLVLGYAWIVAHGAIYSITSRRVVMRVGVALPVTINIPFAGIETASVKLAQGTQGDLVLGLAATHGVSWIMLWPHTRPWRMARAEPMLRALSDAQAPAQILSRALAAAAGQPIPVAPPREHLTSTQDTAHPAAA